MATVSEAVEGTSTDTVLTPGILKAAIATYVEGQVIQYATEQETQTGLVGTKAVTPKSLASVLRNVSYGGGCEDHIFNLVHEFLFCGTPPVHIPLYLTHNSNNDNCEAALAEELCFDISNLYDLCADTSELFISLNDPENNTFIYF